MTAFGPIQARMSRRTLVGAMAGAGLVSVSGFASRALAGESGGQPRPFRYIVTDRRYSESLQFAAAFLGLGIERLEVSEGLTDLWRDRLVPLWRQRGGAVVGLTRRETWVCLAEQGRSARHATVFLAHHEIAEDGLTVAHSLHGSPQAIMAPANLGRAGTSWPTIMAGMALQGGASGERGMPAQCRVADRQVCGVRRGAPQLVSWVIA